VNPYIIPGIRRKPQTQENRIIQKVKLYYRVDCLSENLWARQVCIWVMRKRMKLSYEKIAKLLVIKHDSARYATKKVSDDITTYQEIRDEVRAVVESIYP
jgi:chromosomal replication initiation ATPase DnaA